MWQDHAVSDQTYDEAQDAALEQLAVFLAEDKENVNRYYDLHPHHSKPYHTIHPSILWGLVRATGPDSGGLVAKFHASLCSATFVVFVHGV